jgi:5-oxoprolinase (ATP-hydrolysing) subunit C
MDGPFLRAIAPTPFVTLQDGGRRGWRRFGLSGAGAMDRLSLTIANALVGNRATEAVLEFAYAGGEWMVDVSSCRIAIAGGAFNVTADGVALPPFTSAVLRRGQRLRIGSAKQRVWGYLAVAGGFDIPMEFGSRSTHVRTGIGGIGGRTIQAGDALRLRADRAVNEPERRLDAPPEDDSPCRLVLGPQQDRFDEDSLTRLLREEYQVTWQQDRMAYRLEGPRLQHRAGYNIISDGVVPGCIQIPGTGLPIVLMRDAGTVGGYPKVGTIIEADLGRLAQKRPGSVVHFAAISVDEAHAVRRRFLARMQLIAEAVANPLPDTGA